MEIFSGERRRLHAVDPAPAKEDESICSDEEYVGRKPPQELAPLAPLGVESLDLYQCPVTKLKGYREKVFALVPSLKYLDGVDAEGNDRLESDEDEEEDEDEDEEGDEEGAEDGEGEGEEEDGEEEDGDEEEDGEEEEGDEDEDGDEVKFLF
ncbi:Acidic leucine-rich nuclear phosphoprotein 32-related protein 2 [Triticum urartu]|uniref:Acidic leucine-rich nuclear phosphoprotein 32-related protein 2 n=1 Tax=Triticum urartu TaxID=4572 RepID=M7YGB6_TRIUA|nr:Acidic leucine-rich nuclear phosphoprotein 32-related protein 2 [Triticum urartu]